MAACTRVRVVGATWGSALSTRETVPMPTPAACATSRIVGISHVLLGPTPLVESFPLQYNGNDSILQTRCRTFRCPNQESANAPSGQGRRGGRRPAAH